jgi:hypothetical protein
MENKICSKCNQLQPLERFGVKRRKRKNGTIHVGVMSWCKTCENKRVYIRKTASPEKVIQYKEKANIRRKNSSINNPEREDIKLNIYHLKKTYGLTVEEYNNMLLKQNNTCAICGKPPRKGRRLDVDHCHTTGKVRDLLCLYCNSGIEYFKESPDLLKKAIAYIKHHK